MWKYGTGEDEPSIGLPVGIVASTLSTAHGSGIFGAITMEGSSVKRVSTTDQVTGLTLVGINLVSRLH